MKPRSIAAIMAGLIGIAACSSTEPSLESLTLVADRTTYVAPATVKVTLTNMSSRTVETGVCAGLQRQNGDAWTDVQLLAPCPAILRELESGRSVSAYIDLPAGMPAGEYRAIMGVAGSIAIPAIPTEPFAIQ